MVLQIQDSRSDHLKITLHTFTVTKNSTDQPLWG